MDMKIFDELNTPAECLEFIMDRTEEDGTLTLPEQWVFTACDLEERDVYRNFVFKMKWDSFEDRMRDFDDLVKFVEITSNSWSENEKAIIEGMVYGSFIPDAKVRLEYDAALFARRLCKLMAIGAPKIVTDNEKRNLMVALSIAKCAESLEKVKQ